MVVCHRAALTKCSCPLSRAVRINPASGLGWQSAGVAVHQDSPDSKPDRTAEQPHAGRRRAPRRRKYGHHRPMIVPRVTLRQWGASGGLAHIGREAALPHRCPACLPRSRFTPGSRSRQPFARRGVCAGERSVTPCSFDSRCCSEYCARTFAHGACRTSGSPPCPRASRSMSMA